VFTSIANQGLIAQAATQRALDLRRAFIAAQNFYAWISGVSDAELTSIGFTSGDISLMRSMAADVNALSNVYHGLAPGGAYVLPYPFINSSTLVIGAQP